MADSKYARQPSQAADQRHMLAVEIARSGGPDTLQVVRRAIPVPGPGQVLVAVHAAGVNRPDILQRQGSYPPPPGSSDLPGLEVAGEVIAAGDGVLWPATGDRVTALVAGGGYASHCIAEAALCLPVPAGLTMIEAAALPENWFTVWVHMIDFAQARVGQSVLIHGGGSGIGIAAIQLAQALGLRVFTTAGSAGKVERLGAMAGVTAINYRTHDFVEEIVQATGGAGVDVVIDMVGGSYLARNIAAAGTDSSIALIAAIESVIADGVQIDQIMTKRIRISGNTLRDKSTAYKARVAAALRKTVWPLLESGVATPVIDRTFPLEQASEAHELMESSAHFGKIILTIDNRVDDFCASP